MKGPTGCCERKPFAVVQERKEYWWFRAGLWQWNKKEEDLGHFGGQAKGRLDLLLWSRRMGSSQPSTYDHFTCTCTCLPCSDLGGFPQQVEIFMASGAEKSIGGKQMDISTLFLRPQKSHMDSYCSLGVNCHCHWAQKRPLAQMGLQERSEVGISNVALFCSL